MRRFLGYGLLLGVGCGIWKCPGILRLAGIIGCLLTMFNVIGIDPAPVTPSRIWTEEGLKDPVAPNRVRDCLKNLIDDKPNCLVAWDAPLSSDTNDFYDRNIDRCVRIWIHTKVREGHLVAGAVNARAFAGVPHWVISCKALGLPYGNKLGSLELYRTRTFAPDIEGNYVVEVHPAVAMACMWVDKGITEPFPRYKNVRVEIGRTARKSIVETLDFPEVCIYDDDVLDAYVAYLMADYFIKNKASFVSNPLSGSYVLPHGASFDEIRAELEKLSFNGFLISNE